MSFFWKGRFGEEPSDLLKHYYADTLREPLFLEALHQWDKAQVVVLGEQRLAPPEVIRALANAISLMEAEGVVKARTGMWNVVHGGEEFMRKYCDEQTSGWLHLGRSSPSLRVVASRIAFRDLLLSIMSSTLSLREKLIDMGEQHIESLMPGYSYVQHIEPTTFGFYLLSFVEPLERDFVRLTNAFENADVSSVGTGAAYGIEFPIDLERLDELLGFRHAPWNARDAIRNFDYMVETYMALALMHNTLGRVAMDFLIWHSVEFGFIRLPDRLSITSSISPQMRIPYVLEFVHGTSGLITGRLMGALAIMKSASDQLEMATMLPAEFWKCADESKRAIESMVDALSGMQVDKDRMARGANDHWSQASSLIGYLVKEHGMSYRTGHQILALLMQKVADDRIPPIEVTVEMFEQAVEQYTGRRLGITEEALHRTFDAMNAVRERHYRGGVAPVRVREHIAAARTRMDADRVQLIQRSDHIHFARNKLDAAFTDIKSKYA
ncbi:MAG TPA: lyase family protein [Acidobacteriaceae bacterium]|nr:lyase family protein [Acidobacteriaceae bacterium]